MRLPILDGNELLDDIVGYLGVLNREYRVSVHGVEQVLGPYFQRLLPETLFISRAELHDHHTHIHKEYGPRCYDQERQRYGITHDLYSPWMF